MRVAIRFLLRSAAPVVGLVPFALSAAVAAAEIDPTDIMKCQAMRDDASRLACYDSLKSTSEPPVESAAVPAEATPVGSPPAAHAPPGRKEAVPAQPDAAPVPEQAATPVPLDDEVGQETLRGSAKKDKPDVRGRVVSCREDVTGKYLFYFDNGQIWRQKDNTNVRWRECAFDVTISKDVFGYRMVPDGEKKRVRIARIK